MTIKLRLTILTPVFNEEEVIGRYYERTARVLTGLAGDYDTRLLFVVDRGDDRTMDILREISARDARVQVIAMSSRFGHQMCLLAGMDHAADADVIVMMDSDLQHPPELIPEMITQYNNGYDVVYTIRKAAQNTGVGRCIVNKIFYGVLNYLSDTPIRENAADFRLISHRVGELFRNHIRERNMFMRGLFSWVGFKQAAIEYDVNERLAGQSKYSLSRLLSFAGAGVLSFSTKPLKISIFIGFGLAFLSFLYGLLLIHEYLMNQAIPSGWTTLAMLMLLSTGVQLIFVGVLGAYIGGIYEEVKQRPHYIVDEKINL